MKRYFGTAVLGLAAMALSITPAMAAPPQPVDGAGETNEECGFPVQAELSGKIKFLFLGEGLKILFPSQKATLTNAATGESVTYVIAGAITEAGGTLHVTGHNLVLGQGIGILYTTGNQTFVDVDGTTTLTGSHGKVVDVCEVLAP